MNRSLSTLAFAALLAVAAGCGGLVDDDETRGPAPSGPAPGAPSGGSSSGGAPSAPSPSTPTPTPPPVGPYTGLVGTTDVSILYPLPSAGASRDFVRPDEVAAHGVLLPRAMVDQALGGRSLDVSVSDSRYDALRLVSLRLDPCSSRGAAPGACTSEIRLVFQALHDEAPGPGATGGLAAADGAVHVMVDVPPDELVVVLQEILTLKRASGDLALHELAPHPILAKEGLSGPFAKGLRQVILGHLGGDRVARVTFFDHNFGLDQDGWTFGVFDRAAGGGLVPGLVPTLGRETEIVAGSSAHAPLVGSSAEPYDSQKTKDAVAALVSSGRPAPGAPEVAALGPVLGAALRVQDPRVHDASTTSCSNCHLAEGAVSIASGIYGMPATGGFSHARSLARVDQRTSVTNLHAFGWLGREVSIMQRTANESVLVADRMEKTLAPR